MKTLYTLALGIVLLTAPSMSKANKMIVIEGLAFNGSEENPDCPTQGDDCTIIIIIVDLAIADDGAGNLLVSGGLNQPQVHVDGQHPLSAQASGYIFPQGSTFSIANGEFPGIPAMTIDLSGIQANVQGRWSLKIPKP